MMLGRENLGDGSPLPQRGLSKSEIELAVSIIAGRSRRWSGPYSRPDSFLVETDDREVVHGFSDGYGESPSMLVRMRPAYPGADLRPELERLEDLGYTGQPRDGMIIFTVPTSSGAGQQQVIDDFLQQ